MATFNLKLSDDPNDMKVVSEWLNYEVAKLDAGQDTSSDNVELVKTSDNQDKAEKERKAALDISERIKPFREEAFRKIRERELASTM